MKRIPIVTFLVISVLMLGVLKTTTKKDLGGLENTIVELSELVEEYHEDSEVEDMILQPSSISLRLKKIFDRKAGLNSIVSQVAFEVLTPPPDISIDTLN